MVAGEFRSQSVDPVVDGDDEKLRNILLSKIDQVFYEDMNTNFWKTIKLKEAEKFPF